MPCCHDFGLYAVLANSPVFFLEVVPLKAQGVRTVVDAPLCEPFAALSLSNLATLFLYVVVVVVEG